MKNRIKVLLVDDEKRFCETMSKLLIQKGFNTTIAYTAEMALAILKKAPQDVIVLDIQMTGMDGHSALNEIKKTDPEVQVIMLTGHGTRYSAMRALVREAFDYLAKPCDVDLLASRIQDAYMARHNGFKLDSKKALNVMIPMDDLTVILDDISIKDAVEKILGPVDKDRNMQSPTGKILDFALVFNNRQVLSGILTRMDIIRAVRPDYVDAEETSVEESSKFSSIFWNGFFSDRVKAVAQKKVRDIMSGLPPVISENANLLEVAHLMWRESKRLLLVKDISKVIGIIIAQDIFWEITSLMRE